MRFFVTDRGLYITEDETLVAGSVREYTVIFAFSPAWEDYEKTAVFQTQAGELYEVALTDDACLIPWQVLAEPQYIKIGIRGTKGAQVRPTLWYERKFVEPGAENAEPNPQQESWEAIQAALEQMDEDLTASETARDEAAGSCENAEAYAAGTRNGEPVGTTDDAYHNNAAYYNAQAQTAAQTATAAASGTVRADIAQTLTETEKARARANIDAAEASALEATQENAIISNELKTALLQLASKVAYIDANGQDYYDDLFEALNPPGNLLRIYAVFAQGGVTVYDTDSIDDLKQYLAVTAYYDNGTSSAVSASDYTLSGTLTTGISTITVSYHEKTDTFDVAVTCSLPEGYTKHDYIYNKVRDNNSIIDTNLAPQYNGVGYEHSIEFMMTVDARGSADGLYGLRAYGGSDPKSRALWAKNLSGTNMIAANFGGTDTGFVQNINLNTKYKSVTKNGGWYIDDTLVMDNMDTGRYIEPPSGTIGIFGIYTQTSKGSAIVEGTRIYSFKVVDSSDGSLVADFVPCVNSNNVAGLYDRIRRAFYTAATTSNVEAGDDT